MAKRKNKKQKNTLIDALIVLLLVLLFLREKGFIGGVVPANNVAANEAANVVMVNFDLSEIPEYEGAPYVFINDNTPFFSEDDLADTQEFSVFSDLDSLGRCGTVMALIGYDMMPTEERESIGSVRPAGWHTYKFDFVDGKYLYNRCHLWGFQLGGGNANPLNLTTGTRYLNVDGMLPFENNVAYYLRADHDSHVLYRVTPIFEGSNLVCSGILMEASSVEDSGDGLQFCVYCYNVQPGVEIDYATGEAWEAS